jgi:hypothetical protein
MIMLQVQDGQCGLCMHFGEHHPARQELVQLRKVHSAPESMIDECAHPKLAVLHLKVTPISGCDGFAPAMPN